jgi:ferredoxin
MANTERREIGDLVVEIDRDLCVGFGDCITEVPEALELDADDVAVFREGCENVDREALLRACDACPVDALVALDREGRRLAP